MNPMQQDIAETLLAIIKKRRSVRQFKAEKIPFETIKTLADAARWAPSAGHRQPLEIIVVTDEKVKEQLSKAALSQSHVKNAPVVFVMCGDVARTKERYGERGRNLYVIQDVAAATQNLVLQATAFGLGSVWVGAFNEQRVREILELPSQVRPLAIIPIGIPDEKPVPPEKRPLAQVIHLNKYGQQIN